MSGWRILEKTIKILGTVSSGAVLALMILTTIDVVLRYVIAKPLKGGYEVSEVLFLGAVMLGLAYTQFFKEHVRVEILTSCFRPPLSQAIEILMLLLAIAMYIVFGFAGAKAFWSSFVTGEYRWGLISIPLWPAKLTIPVGVGVLTLRLIEELIIKLREMFKIGEV